MQSVFNGVLTVIEDFGESLASGTVAIAAAADDGAEVGDVWGGVTRWGAVCVPEPQPFPKPTASLLR